MGQTWVRCSSSTRRKNRKRSPIPVSATTRLLIIDSLNVFQLRVPDPDPGDEEENEESKEANK